MKILIVTETWPPEINGVALTVAGYVDGLRARGHEVCVLRPWQQGDRAGAGVRTEFVRGVRIPRYPSLQFGLAISRRIHRCLLAEAPDVMYIATEGPLGYQALRTARKMEVPVITGFHTNFHDIVAHYGFGFLSGAARAWLRHFHNMGANTAVATERLRDELQDMGIRNARYLPRGVDTASFSPARRDPALRLGWGVEHDETPVVLHVGRMAAEKNLDLVVRVFRTFHGFRPDAKLVFVGDGPANPRINRKHPEFVYCGMQTGDALAAHYASADVLLFPSLTETYGNITLEGMASGLAVVAFDYAAAHQLIMHRNNGMLAEYGNDGEFINCATRLARDPELVRVLRKQARVSVEQFDLAHGHAALERLLRECAYAAGTLHAHA